MTRARIYSQSGVGGGNVVGTSNVTLATLRPFLTTSNVTELANLYFTNARVFANLQLASIDDLRDVNVAVKSNAQALLWDSSTNVWYAGNVATSVTISTLSPFLTTANVAESNSNLYYTNARARTALTAADPTIIIDYATGTIRANIAAVSNVANTTDSISEGFTNQYFTNARVNAFIQPWLTTANVREFGNSLYFTNARVVPALNYANLVDLGDVTYTGTPSNNQVLTWNSVGGYWTNATANAGSAAASAGFAETSNVANTVLTLSNFTTYDLAPDPNGVNPYFSNTRVLALFSPGGNTQITTSNIAEGSNLYFTNARAQAAVTLSAITPYLTTANVRESVSNLYYTNARVLSYIGTLSTSNLAEGSNLYYTNTRVNAYVQPYLTTANVRESTSNLYFTNARVYANIAPLLTTANIIESVSNLYYTNARVNAYVQPYLTTANILESANTLFYTNARVLANIAASNIATQFLTVTGNIYATDNVTTSKNLILAKNASAASANGLGIYIDGANASILYNDNTKSLDLNKNIIVTGNILPSTSGVYNLGSPDKKFLSLYLGTQTLYIGNVSLGESPRGGLAIQTPSGLPSDASFANITATESVTVSRYANVTTRVEANGYFGGNVAEFINNKTGNIYYGIKKNDNWGSFAGMRVSETRTIAEPVYNTYTWYVANSFATDYVLSGYSSGSDIPLTVTAGDTLVFVVNAPTHDLWIKTASTTGTGQGVTTGTVTNNGKDIGNVTWNTTGVVPGTYYYHSANDVSMGSTITVLADTYALGNVRSDIIFYNDNEITNNSVARLSILGDGNTIFYGNIYHDTGSKIYSNLVGNVTGYVSSIANHSTDNLREGTSLYYTNSRTRSTLSGSTGVTYDTSNGTIAIGQDVSTTANVTFRNLTVTNNVNIYGNVVTYSSNNLSVSDNMIYLNNGSTESNPDIGFAFNYNDGGYHHGGFYRDHADGRFKVFDNYDKEPDANIFIDSADSSYRLANIQATTFYGNLSGQVAATSVSASSINSSGNTTVSGALIANANIGLKLGTPSLGALVSNAITLTTTTTVTDGITQLNQILGKLVPPAPPTLSTATGNITISGVSSYRICNFTQTINGPTATQASAGATVTTVLRSNTWATTTINDVGPGDSGTVTVYLNGVAAGSKTLASGSDNGVYGNLYISDNVDYATKSSASGGFWESMDLRANSTVSPEGWNEVYITHSLGSASNVALWYNDRSSPGTPTATGTTFAPTTNSYTYSSNVPHFNSSTVWTLATNVNKLSGDFYYSSDTFITGASGTGFQTPASITYTAASITTPLARNLYATSGNVRVTTTSSIATGFGRATTGLGPTLTVNNGYSANSAVVIPYTGNVLYKTGTASTMEETSITVGSTVGTGSTTVSRIINPGSGDNPTYSPSATLYTSTTALQTYDAAIVGAVLRNDTTDYSSGHWPNFGPNLSSQASSQYFTFRLVRTSLSKFDIKYTGNIAGMWIAVPGSTIDNTSTANGWLDMSIAYGGSGIPGANVSQGGNGSQGCALGGVIGVNRSVTAASNTATFGTVSTSSTGTNEVYVRIKLTTGQSITALSLETASH